MPPQEAGRTSGLIDATADWLMTQALGDTSMERLVEGCCARLWGAGVPLCRVMIGYRTLHPLFTGVSHIWRRDAPLVTERHDQRRPDAAAAFNRGPHGWMLRIERRLAVACKVTIKDQIAHDVLATYLGREASEAVLSGQIQRGDGRTMPVVLWYSDLRDSTSLSEAMPVDAFFAVLNRYFECSAGAVLAEGGRGVQFIGDAVLGIFPVDHDAVRPDACAAAMAAARRARRDLERFNAERAAAKLEPLALGIGLHAGDVK